MTVSECLRDWLTNYDELNIADIATDFIESDEGSFSISKSPNTSVIDYVDGSKLVTEYYQFFARRNTQLDDERVENQQVLNDLEEWVEEQNMEENLPDLSQIGNLTCQEVSITNSATITSQEDDDSIYQITFSIQYLKER